MINSSWLQQTVNFANIILIIKQFYYFYFHTRAEAERRRQGHLDYEWQTGLRACPYQWIEVEQLLKCNVLLCFFLLTDLIICRIAIAYSMEQIMPDAQLTQRDRAAGCVIVLAKRGKLELGDNILQTI